MRRDYPLEDSLVQDFRCKAEQHALEQFPKEACGVLVNDLYHPCNNIADQSDQIFILDPRDYIRARAKGKIQAIIHSHPAGGGASPVDQMACTRFKLPWYIYLIPEDEWITIFPS